MATEQGRDATQAALDAVAEAVRAWRREHPTATFAEIEIAVEERLAAVRARLVAEAAGTATEPGAAEGRVVPRPPCPQCGQDLQRRGQRVRDVTIRGGETVRLARHYGCCLACGAGLFPPR